MSALTISKFYDVASRRDFSRDFLFRVEAINILGMSFNPDELIYIKGGSLPSRKINNLDLSYMGMKFNTPGTVAYDSTGWQVKMYVDATSTIRNRLEVASRALFNDATSTGYFGTPGKEHRIVLHQLNKKLEPINRYILVGASLRDIGAINYDISDGSGKPVEVDVTFAYQYYELEPCLGLNVIPDFSTDACAKMGAHISGEGGLA